MHQYVEEHRIQVDVTNDSDGSFECLDHVSLLEFRIRQKYILRYTQLQSHTDKQLPRIRTKRVLHLEVHPPDYPECSRALVLNSSKVTITTAAHCVNPARHYIFHCRFTKHCHILNTCIFHRIFINK